MLLQGSPELNGLVGLVLEASLALDADVAFQDRTHRGDVTVHLRDRLGASQGHLTVFRALANGDHVYEVTLRGTVPDWSSQAGTSVTAEISFGLTFAGDSLTLFTVCLQSHPHQTTELLEHLGDIGPMRTGAIQEYRPGTARWMPLTLMATGNADEVLWTRALGEWSAREESSLDDPRFEHLLSFLRAIRGLCKDL